MSKTLIVGARASGRHHWPVIVRDDAIGSLSGGLSVASFTELESLALQMSARVECPRLVRAQMLEAGVGPTPLFAEDDEGPMLPLIDLDTS